MLKESKKLKLEGGFADGTILFIDIERFTQLAERTDAKELIRILNRYLGSFADIVLASGGMVDKIAGDSLMAVWGVPLAFKNHAGVACETALLIQQKLFSLHENETEKINIRIGINSGSMLAGNVGGKKFWDYTVHGMDVNISKRLEEANKVYNTRILVGENTQKRAADFFIFREIDTVRIQGISVPINIYELVGSRDGINQDMLIFLDYFNRGRDLYKEKKWAESKKWFEKGLELNPFDKVCDIYVNRLNRFETNPPDRLWDGAIDI